MKHSAPPADCPGPENCDHPQRRKWYLDRGISIPNLIALLTFLLTVGGVINRMDNRQTSTEKDVQALKAMDEIIQRDRLELKKDIVERLDRIERRLEGRR